MRSHGDNSGAGKWQSMSDANVRYEELQHPALSARGLQAVKFHSLRAMRPVVWGRVQNLLSQNLSPAYQWREGVSRISRAGGEAVLWQRTMSSRLQGHRLGWLEHLPAHMRWL